MTTTGDAPLRRPRVPTSRSGPPSPDVVSSRTALLDAAYAAVLHGDWERTRMVDVAGAARVSRQTLYNEFGSKDGLAVALAERETRLFLQRTDAAYHGGRDVAESLEAGVTEALRVGRANPLVRAVLTSAPDSGLLPFLTTRGDLTLSVAASQLARNLRASRPGIDDETVRLVAEAVPRLVISHLVLPTGSAESAAQDIVALVLPYLSRPAAARQAGSLP